MPCQHNRGLLCLQGCCAASGGRGSSAAATKLGAFTCPVSTTEAFCACRGAVQPLVAGDPMQPPLNWPLPAERDLEVAAW